MGIETGAGAADAGTLASEFIIKYDQLVQAATDIQRQMGDIRKSVSFTADLMVRENRAAESSYERVAKKLEQQAASFGMSAQEARQLEAATQAAAASAAGFDGYAQRIVAAERAIYDAEFAAKRLAQAQRDEAEEARAAARAEEELAAAAVRLKASIDPLGAAHDRLSAELAQAQTLYERGKISATEYGQANAVLTQRLAETERQQEQQRTALARGTAVSGEARAGMQQLSFQLNDVAVGFAAGTPPMVIFAQQSGQVIQALSMMSTGTSGFLGFLGGPWGIAITSALVVLTPFVSKLWEAGDAADASKDKIRGFATAADLAQQTDQVMQMTQSLGELRAEYNRMAGATAQGQKFFANTVLGKSKAAEIREQEEEIRSTRAIIDLRDRQIRQIETSDAAAKAAVIAKREHNKELREEAKAAREAAKAQRELQSAYDALIGKYAPLMSAEQDYARAVADIGDVLKARMVTDAQAADMRMAALQDYIKASRAAGDVGLISTSVDLSGVTQDLDGVLRQVGSLHDVLMTLPDTVGPSLGAFADSWGKVGSSIEGAVHALHSYAQAQEQLAADDAVRRSDKYSAAERDAADARFRRVSATAEIGLYGDLTRAAKGFFGEKSSGYKALEKAEKAFRAIELALSIRAMVQDAAATAAKVANSGVAAAASAVEAVAKAIASMPFPLNLAAGAATAAALASIGLSVAGSFGGGGGNNLPKANEGTGTVFGDADAKSDSIKRAIDALSDIDTVMLGYSRQMAASLKNIENNIGGLSNLIVRIGGVDGLNASAGVETGFKTNMLGKALGGAPGGLLGTALGSVLLGPLGGIIGGVIGNVFSDVIYKIPVIGDILGGIGKIVGGLFGTKTKVIGSGIYGGPQTYGDIDSLGFDANTYSDIKKTKKFFGVSTGSKYSTQYGELDSEISDQFGKLIGSFGDAIMASAGPLGLSLDTVEGKLNSFVVDIGKIDLQGLTGEEIQKKLEAVFGATADNMARAAIDGLNKFQAVGEGYFETLVRVASTVETVTASLQQLGLATQSIGIDASMSIAGLFDSVSSYSSAIEAYFSTYYSEAEQTAARTAQLGRVFDSLGMAMPATVQSFRALVEAQDLTTAAGQQTYATLLQLAPAFADIVTAGQSAVSTAAVMREQMDLQRALLQEQGNTAALRALDLQKIDPANRALQEQIWALQDAKAAQQAAAAARAEAAQRAQQAAQKAQQAADQAARAAEQLRQAWATIADGILDEVKRIRGVSSSGSQNYASLLGQFNAATTAARAGDQDAAKGLPTLSKSLLDVATQVATSRQELARVQAMTAASLEQTYRVITSVTGASASGGAGAASSADNQAWWQNYAAMAAATPGTPANDGLVAEVKVLRKEIAGMRSDNNAGNAVLSEKAGKTVEMLDTAIRNGGGKAFAVREVA